LLVPVEFDFADEELDAPKLHDVADT
jgi:hypothetical protein